MPNLDCKITLLFVYGKGFTSIYHLKKFTSSYLILGISQRNISNHLSISDIRLHEALEAHIVSTGSDLVKTTSHLPVATSDFVFIRPDLTAIRRRTSETKSISRKNSVPLHSKQFGWIQSLHLTSSSSEPDTQAARQHMQPLQWAWRPAWSLWIWRRLRR